MSADPLASLSFTQAFNDCRSKLRDIQTAGGDRYTDTMLLGISHVVHSEIQEVFASRDIEFGEKIDYFNFNYTAPPKALGTTAASITSNVATLTFGSDPTAAPYSFGSGSTIFVNFFTGEDSLLNGIWTLTGVSSGSKTVSFALTNPNYAATTNGQVLPSARTDSTSPAGSIIDINPAVLDMYEPIEVWQETELSEWSWVNRRDRIQPNIVIDPTLYLTDWEWSEGKIKVNPCQTNMNIMVRYSRQIALAGSASSLLGFSGFYLPFVYGVCAEASIATERPAQAQAFQLKYQMALSSAIQRAVRREQGTSQRWGRYPSRRGRGAMTTPSVNVSS